VATDLIEIDQESPGPSAIEQAASAIRRGRVVAIPTDALYSLVADPFSLHAVGLVFVAKGREIHRSLPLLVSDILMAEDLAKDLSSRFFLLARMFWPGPLTLIVPASAKVPLKVTGNTGRLAVRQSRSKVAAALVENLQQPLVATSANISDQPDTLGADEVLIAFATQQDDLAAVVDGGAVPGGVASTVVDVSVAPMRVLREGPIGREELARVAEIS